MDSTDHREVEELADRLLEATRVVADELRAAGSRAGLDVVVATQQLIHLAQDALQAAVDQARRGGCSWQEIGDALQTSRQAAFQRFGHPSDPRTGEDMSARVLPGAADNAIEVVAELAQHQWERVRRDFTPRMADALDADGLAAAWAQVAGMVGRYEGVGEPLVRQLGDYTVVEVPLSFEAGQMTGRISYTSAGQVAGLYILRPEDAQPTANG